MYYFVLLSLCATPSQGWGGDIHRKITEDALKNPKMSRVGRKYLTSHLGSDERSIIRESTWADSEEASAKYPGSDDLHFSNTPWRACAPFDLARDCGFQGSGQCIVTGIADMVMIAIDPSRSKDERVDAIRFVLHLVADIHQPLHTGFMKDSGGCNILLNSEPKMSLHQMWDHGLIEANKKEASSAAGTDYVYDASVVPIPSEISTRDTLMDYASALATESSTMFTCNVAYRDETGEFIVSKKALSPQYIESRKQIARDRVTAASHRLAELIVLMAETFAQNKLRNTQSSATLSTASISTFLSTNAYEVLDMEFEPDDLVEDLGAVISHDFSGIGKKKQSRPRRVYDGVIPASDEPIFRVGKADLRDVVLYKAHETYWITCGEFVRQDLKYIPMLTTTFRVRFMRNRHRNDPVLLVTDAACFGPVPLDRNQFMTVLKYLSGQPITETSSAAGFGAPIATATKQKTTHPICIEPVRGEVTEYGPSISYPSMRGWAINHLDNPEIIRSHLSQLRNLHREKFESLINETEARNSTLDQKWDRDFYSNFASIRYVRYGDVMFWFHLNFFTDSHEARFTMYEGSDSEGNVCRVLMDTSLFDGLITPRIHKAIWALVGKRHLSPLDPLITQRKSFMDELKDISTLLTKTGRDRADSFRAIKGYFMYTNFLGSAVSYIEWTTKPLKENLASDISTSLPATDTR